MENMNTVLAVMTKACYMANIGLKDAYHSVAVRSEDREPTVQEEGQFILNFFLRSKSQPGKFRLIFNLKTLNEHVRYEHFKMENIHTATAMVTQGCNMANIDLKDAYHSVEMRSEDRKFLKLEWKGCLYQFCALPFGLACAPLIFTRLLKPILASLRSRGQKSVCYLDDLLLFGNSYELCALNVRKTTDLLVKAGFVINVTKSNLTPTKEIIFLGFTLNSENMSIAFHEEKRQKTLADCENLAKKPDPHYTKCSKSGGKTSS